MDLTEKQIAYFWERVDKTGGEDACWNWTFSCFTNGYGRASYNNKSRRSHVLALTLSAGPPPKDKPYALHSCKQNRKCCNPAHLRWGNAADNSGDMVKDGTSAKGELQGCSKLTDAQVLEIRAKYKPWTYPMSKLVEEYGVSERQIGRIINRESWTHI